MQLNMSDKMSNMSIKYNGLDLFDTEEKRIAAANYVENYPALYNDPDDPVKKKEIIEERGKLWDTTIQTIFGDVGEIDVTVWMDADESSYIVGINKEMTKNYLDKILYRCQPDWDFIIWQGKLKNLSQRFWYNEAPFAVWLGERDGEDVYMHSHYLLQDLGYKLVGEEYWQRVYENSTKGDPKPHNSREMKILFGLSESI